MAASLNLRLIGGNELDLSGGQLHFVSGAEGVRQAIETRLKLIRGEWFLDTEAGIPLFERILGKGASVAIVKNEIRKVIETTPGVVAIRSLTVTIDRATRAVSADFTVTTTSGETSSGSA